MCLCGSRFQVYIFKSLYLKTKMYFCLRLSQHTFCFSQKTKNVRTHFIRSRPGNYAEFGVHRTHLFPAHRNQFFQRSQTRDCLGYWRGHCGFALHSCQLLCQCGLGEPYRQTSRILPDFRLSDSYLCHLYASFEDKNAHRRRGKTHRPKLHQNLSQRIFTQFIEYRRRPFLARNRSFCPKCLSKSGGFRSLHWDCDWNIFVDRFIQNYFSKTIPRQTQPTCSQQNPKSCWLYLDDFQCYYLSSKFQKVQ